MTTIVGTLYVANGGVSPVHTFTVPTGVTTGMTGLFAFGTADGVDPGNITMTGPAGSSFTELDERSATNTRVWVGSGTGLTAGDTVTLSFTTTNKQVALLHLYTDEWTFPGTVAAGVRGASSTSTTTGALTPAAGQRVVVVGVERTLATPTVVTSVTSSGGETVSELAFAESGATTPTVSVYLGSFVASAAESRTATITYDDASGNGYAALLLTTPTSTPVVHEDSGGAAATTAGSGARTVTSAVVHTDTGGAVAVGAGTGTVVVSTPGSIDRAGGAAATTAGSGVKAQPPTKTGAGAARGAGGGTKTVAATPTLTRPGNQGIQGADRIRVACRSTTATSARLAVSTTSGMASPVFSAAVTLDGQGYALLERTGLAADTDYWWQIELDGTLVGDVGRSRTLPAAGSPASFSFLVGGCAATGSTSTVFDTMRTRTGPGGRRALFMAHVGDAQYVYSGGAVAPSSASDLRAAHEQALSADRQRQLYRDVPVSYVWSDVDFGGSNSDGTWAGNSVHQTVYRQLYASPVPAGSGIYRSWVAGRVRFVHTDGRTFMSAKGDPDTSSKTLLGATQKQWFKDQLLAAKAAGQAVMWFHDNTWGGAAVPVSSGVEDWRVFTTERTELADFITANAIPMLGYARVDVHQLKANDGTGVPAAIPTFGCGPLDQTSSTHPEPSSAGTYPTTSGVQANQFGWFDLDDDGTTITLVYRGIDSGGTQRLTMTRTVNPAPAEIAKTGGAVAVVAGSGARSTVRARAGSATATTAGSGAKTVTSAAVHAETGAAAPTVAGSAVAVVSAPAVVSKTGGAATTSAGSGADAVIRSRTGSAAPAVSGTGARVVSEPAITQATGGATTTAAGSGTRSVTAPTVWDQAGSATAATAGSGSSTVVRPRAGAAAAAAAGSGGSAIVSAVVHVKAGAGSAAAGGTAQQVVSTPGSLSRAGGAAAGAAGSGGRSLISPTVHTRTGGGAARAAGSGSRTVVSATVHTRAGGAAARTAGTAPRLVVPAAAHTRAGGGGPRVCGAGSYVVDPTAGVSGTGGATVGVSGSGSRLVVPAESHVKSGGGVCRAAGVAGVWAGPLAPTGWPPVVTGPFTDPVVVAQGPFSAPLVVVEGPFSDPSYAVSQP